MRALRLSRVGITASGIPTAPTPPTFPEAEWLMGLVASDGALRETPDDVNVRPYMSNYGCLGLIRAYSLSATFYAAAGTYLFHDAYIEAAWDWLFWYAAHMDPTTGYINDFHAASPAPAVDWIDSGAADSTDAYAGMYLTALWLAISSDNHSDAFDKLNALASSITLAVTAITSTQQADGLTWALPTYTVEYLEDNIESLVGLRSAVHLYDLLSVPDPTAKAVAQDAADEMGRGMGYLWNEEVRSWDYAIHEDHAFAHNDWGDENSRRQQIWASAWGAQTVGTQGAYDSVALTLAGYETALSDWADQTSSYEVLPFWVYERTGTDKAANLATMQANIDSAGHAYPWTVATAGQYIWAQYGIDPSLLPPGVIFPLGLNLLPNPTFSDDTNSDGEADGLSNYGDPTMTLTPLTSGTGNMQRMVVPTGNGWNIHWDPIAVTPGHYYTFSFFRRINAVDSGASINIKYELLKSDGSNSSIIPYGYIPLTSTDSTAVRWSITTFIPTDTVTMRCVVEIGGGGSIDIAYAKLEDAGSPTDWTDTPVFP